MAFDNLESSLEDGSPIYLYLFRLNDKAWRYTSADADISAGGFTWVAVPISDDGVKQTGETSTDALTVTVSSTVEPAQIYMNFPPSRPMSLAILRTHDVDLSDIKVVYLGEVSQHNVATPGASVFTCETLSASMQREGLRLSWQRDCPYALYDSVTCKVDKTLYAVVGVSTAVADGNLTVPAFTSLPDGYLSGGFIEWVDADRGIERRALSSNGPGGVLLMFGSTDGLTVGMTVTAYPGCSRTTTGCKSFNNFLNYGGIPNLAGKSPFDGNPVFI